MEGEMRGWIDRGGKQTDEGTVGQVCVQAEGTDVVMYATRPAMSARKDKR